MGSKMNWSQFGSLSVIAMACIATVTATSSEAASKRIKVGGNNSSFTVSPTPSPTPTPTSTSTSSTSTTTTTTTTTSGTTTTVTSPTTPTDTTTSTALFLPTISPDLTPKELNFAGRKWRVNSGATFVTGMGHSVQRGQEWQKIRFEVRNTADDNSSADADNIRRAELSGSIYGDPTRLPNGTSLWGAFSTKHHSWADPVGMRALKGGVYGQIHIGSKFGGSPAVAFRRKDDGAFRVTTRGEFDTGGSIRYEGPLSFDQVHDIVYNVVLHPTAGKLRVWVDGTKIVDISNVSIGSSYADSYWAFGAYFAGGVTSPVIAEYANMTYPGTTSLLTRTTSRPAWPSN